MITPAHHLLSREELKKLSQTGYCMYIDSLTPEQSEELWGRDDAPYITLEVMAGLEEESRKIDSGEIETFGPFETTKALTDSLHEQ